MFWRRKKPSRPSKASQTAAVEPVARRRRRKKISLVSLFFFLARKIRVCASSGRQKSSVRFSGKTLWVRILRPKVGAESHRGLRRRGKKSQNKAKSKHLHFEREIKRKIFERRSVRFCLCVKEGTISSSRSCSAESIHHLSHRAKSLVRLCEYY